MVGGEIFSETQGPKNLQNRNQRTQRLSLVIGRITARQPVSDTRECLTEKGKSRLGAVQSVGPATERRGIGTRLGSLSVGVASSQEQCSTNRRRNA
jgi:hypothetical protein